MAKTDKSLLEALAESPLTPRAAFLARKDEIAAALEEGHTKKIIWQKLKDSGQFAGHYETFLRYVERFIVNAEAAPKVRRRPVAATAPPPAKESKPEPVSQEKTIQTFQHNPNSTIDDFFGDKPK